MQLRGELARPCPAEGHGVCEDSQRVCAGRATALYQTLGSAGCTAWAGVSVRLSVRLSGGTQQLSIQSRVPRRHVTNRPAGFPGRAISISPRFSYSLWGGGGTGAGRGEGMGGGRRQSERSELERPLSRLLSFVPQTADAARPATEVRAPRAQTQTENTKELLQTTCHQPDTVNNSNSRKRYLCPHPPTHTCTHTHAYLHTHARAHTYLHAHTCTP